MDEYIFRSGSLGTIKTGLLAHYSYAAKAEKGMRQAGAAYKEVVLLHVRLVSQV